MIEFPAFARVVAQTFMVNPDRITASTTAGEIEGWDSISHATLMMTLEDRYAIRFDDSDITDLSDVGALYDRVVVLSRMAR